jgi:DNA-binding YbaB/EbfC family protein
MSFDLSKLAEQAMQMQKEAQRLQEEAANETVTATAGGGMVSVTATGAGEIKEIRIDPQAIDPSDPELLGDIVTAAVNEALRAANDLMQAKVGSIMPSDLGGLLPGL